MRTYKLICVKVSPTLYKDLLVLFLRQETQPGDFYQLQCHSGSQ